ncbi:hypothetical protein C1H46_012955 [Malus baccata]|uniref:Uncharacterized protein n=1 Tax=Malus baccata TaxID=106549 RepID=A0A540MRQ4_MALBA|nr:hypothetical protein C1H46_012955 [Malus baccata]
MLQEKAQGCFIKSCGSTIFSTTILKELIQLFCEFMNLEIFFLKSYLFHNPVNKKTYLIANIEPILEGHQNADDECGASGVLVRPDAKLPYCAVLAEDVVHLLALDVEEEVADVEHAVDFWWEAGVDFAEADCAHSGGFGGVWIVGKRGKNWEF